MDLIYTKLLYEEDFMKLRIKMLMISLAIAMTFTSILSGCDRVDNSGSSDNQSNISDSSGTSNSETAEETFKVDRSKIITLRIYGGETEKTFTPGIQNDPVAQLIKEELGIIIDVVQRTTAEAEKVMIASGDLPDVMQVFSENSKAMVKANMLLPLDELVNKYAPDLKQNADLPIKYSKEYLSALTGPDQGKLFVIPGGIDTGGDVLQLVAPFVRWDYYADLGYPEIKNYDDLLNVVSEMLEKNPVNEDGQSFYGFSPWFDWGSFPFHIFTGYMTGKSISSGGLELDMFSNIAKDWVFNDDGIMYEGVRFWNKANRMGLLDPNALTQKYDTSLEKGAQNRILCQITSWHQGNTNNDLEAKGFSGRGMQALPPFEGTENYVGFWSGGWGNVDRGWTVSKDTKYPDRAIDFINYLFSIEGAMNFHNGPKDEYWTEDSGSNKLTEKFMDAQKNNPNFVLDTGAGKYNTWVGLGGWFIAPNGQPLKLLNDKETTKSNYIKVDNDYINYYDVEVKGDTAKKFAKNVEVKSVPNTATPMDTPADIKIIDAKFEDLINVSFPRMVLAKSDDELNEMIEAFRSEAKKLGIEKSQEFYLQQNQSARENLTKFYEKIGYTPD